MKHLKQTVLLLLALSLLFASCAKEPDIPAESTAPVTGSVPEETTSLEPDLPDIYYDGADFTILNGNTATWMTVFAVTTEGENGDSVNDAIYRRNLAVEEKYGVNLVEKLSGSAKADLLAAFAAGDETYDIALVGMMDALAVALEDGALDYAGMCRILMLPSRGGSPTPQTA